MKFVAVIQGKDHTVEVVRRDGKYSLCVEGKEVLVDAARPTAQTLSLLIGGTSYDIGVEKNGSAYSITFFNDTIGVEIFEAGKFKAAEIAHKSVHSGVLKLRAPMPGKIVKVAVAEKTKVKAGDALLIVEAMKMQNELKAPRAGTVVEVHAVEGEAVTPSQILIVME